MKKKMIFAGIAILILVWLFIYFRPIQLSNSVSENNTILISVSKLGVRDGAAYVDSTDYKDITDEQKSNIISLFESYSYRRTFGTLFSDGSMSGTGDKLICIFVYNGNTLVDSIFISSTGQFSVDDKTYKIRNATQLIDQIVEICNLY